jgi:hypothetical protein
MKNTTTVEIILFTFLLPVRCREFLRRQRKVDKFGCWIDYNNSFAEENHIKRISILMQLFK